jgi:PAS domain S-box-containing protein
VRNWESPLPPGAISTQTARHGRVSERVPARGKVTPRVASAASFATDPFGRVIAWSSAAERIFGWRQPEVIGRPLPVLPPDRRAEVEAMLDLARTGKAMPDLVTRWRRRDGGEVTVHLSSTPIHDTDGRLTGVLNVVMEPPPRYEPSADSTRMEAVGRLAGGVAHDFSNILTAIEGYAGLLAGEMPIDDPKQADLAEIRKAADRAKRLIRQLLAFGRREAHQAHLLDVNEVITDVMPMLRQLLGPSIEVITSSTTELRPVLADPTQLEQVLVNLVLNARDAMPDGGRLVVSTANVHLDAAFARRNPGAHPGPYVRLTVEDTGTGMDEGTLAHTFEPYFTTKEPGKGTGLGLSTVYGIVKQNGGYIRAESTMGRGTTISVWLPRR